MKTHIAWLVFLGSVFLMLFEIVQVHPVYGLVFLAALGLFISGVYLSDLAGSDDDTDY